MTDFSRMFSLIRQYREALQPSFVFGAQDMEKFREMSLALFIEVSEIVQGQPWKPWRPADDVDLDNFKEEIVDCLFFLQGLCHSMGVSGEEIERQFYQKLEENYSRITRGYNEVK